MNVELYDLLKHHIGEEAARALAREIPPRDEIARREDVELSTAALRSHIEGVRAELKGDMNELRIELRTGLAGVQVEIARSQASTTRWMLTFFVPLWIGVWAVVLALAIN